MKKSLIAIAIAAAVPAIASAQQVTIFGIMDGGYNSVTTKTTTEVTRNQTGGNAAGALASNRLGFRGTEDLGGGMKAGFHYEMGMDAGGTGDLATTGGVRKSTVSLSGGFGAVEIGRDYNPIFLLSAAADTSRADNVNIGKTVYVRVATTRNSGLITYTTPSMGGLTGKVAYSNRSASPNASGDVEAVGGSLVYSAGPLMVGLAVNNQKSFSSATASSTREETLLGATYMVSKELSLQGMYGDLKVTGGATDYKGTQIGARYMVSPSITLLGSVGQGDGFAGDVTGYKLGATSAFSARTRLYALYGSDKLEKGAAKTERSEIAIGLNHSF